MHEPAIGLRKLKNNAFITVVSIMAIISAFPLIFIIVYVLKQGAAAINWHFFFELPKPVGETGGGIANALVGTILIVLGASVMAIPFGLLAGVYLAEHPDNKLSNATRLAVEVLNGTPSIVVGVFAFLVIVMSMGGFSGFSGSFALAVMMLPLVVRTTEETLKLIPDTLKEAALALGAPYYRVIFKVVIPSGLSGIVNGIMLAIARVTGETAPLLFTAFGNHFMNYNMLKPMSNLPLIIFNYAMNPYKELQKIAWGASLVLVAMVLLMNLLSRWVIKKWKVRF